MPAVVKRLEEPLTLSVDRGFSNSDVDLALIPFPHPPLTFRKTKSQNGNTEGFTLPAFHTVGPKQQWSASPPPVEQTPHIRIDLQIGYQLVTKLRLLSGEVFAR